MTYDSNLKMQHDLELERDELVNKLYSLDQNLQEVLQENKHLSDQVNVDKQTIGQLQQEAKDLIMVRDEVQQKADTVKRVRWYFILRIHKRGQRYQRDRQAHKSKINLNGHP